MSAVTDNKVKKANATISDIAEFLGLGSSSTLNAVCQASGINKWAKYKPIAWETMKGLSKANGHPTPLTAAEITSVNYGLVVPTSSTNPFTAAAKSWTYTVPTSNDWCRITDFLNPGSYISGGTASLPGYDSDAVAPVRKGAGFPSAMEFSIFSYKQITHTILLTVSGTASSTSISLSDLPAIKDYYLAFCWQNENTNYVRTASTTLSQGGDSITLLSSDQFGVISGGEATLNYCLCVCTTCHPADSSSTTATANGKTYYPLPFTLASYAVGTIHVTRKWPFKDITVSYGDLNSSIWFRSTKNNTWSQVSFFVNHRAPVSGDDNQFLAVNSNGDLFIKINLTNETTSELVYPSSLNADTYVYWGATLVPSNLSGASTPASARKCTVLAQQTDTTTSDIHVMAGGIQVFYLKCPEFFKYYNGNNKASSLASNKAASGYFVLSINGIQILKSDIDVNFCTMDYVPIEQQMVG